MPGKTEVAVGDIVYVYRYYTSRDSEVREARVERVGRVLITLSINGHELREEFRLDNGYINSRDHRTGSCPYFRTAGQKAVDDQMAADDAIFRAARLSHFGSNLTRADIHDIAELLRSHGYTEKAK